MKKCKEVSALCSQELEHPLALKERVGVVMHVMMCSSCANFRRHIRLLHRKMGEYADGLAPSETADPGSQVDTALHKS